jgi:hypothetical protein
MTKLINTLADKALAALLPNTTAGAVISRNCWNYCGTDGYCRWCCLSSTGHLTYGIHHRGCKPC